MDSCPPGIEWNQTGSPAKSLVPLVKPYLDSLIQIDRNTHHFGFLQLTMNQIGKLKREKQKSTIFRAIESRTPTRGDSRMTPSSSPSIEQVGDTTRSSFLRRLALVPADETAWRLFIQRYGRRICHWCNQWGLQEADIEEVTSKVLLKLVNKLRDYTYDPTGSFRAYLRMITQNSLRDYYQERKQMGACGSGDDRVVVILDNQTAREDLFAKLHEEFDLELLEYALTTVQTEIQARDWEVFRLLAIEGLSGDEVARQVGIPTAHTYVIRGRVLKRIKEVLQQIDEGSR
jgi:RNA polymerase sigma factor (sigma-70 family)